MERLPFRTGSRHAVFYGYIVGAVVMVGAAAVEAALGVKAERMSLERVAPPLSASVE